MKCSSIPAWKSDFSYYFVQTWPLFYDAFKEVLGLLSQVLISRSLFRFVYIMIKFSKSSWHGRYKIIWYNFITMINFGKSNIWLIRKMFQNQAKIFIRFTVWIIHQNGLNQPRFSCSLRFWRKLRCPRTQFSSAYA